MTPCVSVILPVYNADRFLREAIESILCQSFTDFEFIIANDGSTDNSEDVILSHADDRIVYLKNDTNQGLIFSLNRMIDAAKGLYIARMDADDVALPYRLEKQVEYMRRFNPAVAATTVDLIDEAGKGLPPWSDDRRNVAPEQIRRFLRRDNCIAHPSVLCNAELLRIYRYRTRQKFSEDYDLWLRLAADGHVIRKMTEPLLRYRILPGSATRGKKFNVFLRLAKVKFRFVQYQVSRTGFTPYARSVFFFACLNLLQALGKEAKAIFNK